MISQTNNLIKETTVKDEDCFTNIIKKEENNDTQVESFGIECENEQTHQNFEELFLKLENYLETFVSVEDFELKFRALGEKEAQELISEAKSQFKEWGLVIIRSLGENLKKNGVPQILPEHYLINLIEKTKRRIFNSYKQLKKNLSETLSSLYGKIEEIKPNERKPQKRIIKKKSDFPDRARTLLKTWFIAHAHDPYPSHEEKISLAREGGISIKQLENWLTNTRGRIWKKMQKEANFCNEIEKTLLIRDEGLF